MDEPLFEEKQTFHPFFHLLLVGAGLAAVAAGVYLPARGAAEWTSSDVLLPFGIGVLLLLLWVLLFRMSTTVRPGEMRLEWGFVRSFRKRFDLQFVNSVEVVTFSPMRDFGGWGIRRGREGMWCFTVSGSQGVKLGVGDRAFLVGSQRAHELRQAIQAACGR